MKQLILGIIMILSFSLSAQSDSSSTSLTNNFEFFPKRARKEKKVNKVFLYWGYNRGWYSKSDIHLKGPGYDYTINNVIAKDRPTPFEIEKYFYIQNLTIPQTNLKFGYQINYKWSFSFGVDHMKYVMQNDQRVNMTGRIDRGTGWDGNYQNESILLTEDLLIFEHTDGLNYINLEAVRWKSLLSYKNYVFLDGHIGAGAGALLPKTRAILFNETHHDDFHWSGYGMHFKTGLKLDIGPYFFIQSDLKGGFINMPDIKPTDELADKASQHFFFGQFNWLVGIQVPIAITSTTVPK